MATTEPTSDDTRRGFPGLSCLNCGEEDTVVVYLTDMTLSCRDCGAEWTAEEVRGRLRTWSRVLSWLDTAPTVD